jgi:hypothetical protein
MRPSDFRQVFLGSHTFVYVAVFPVCFKNTKMKIRNCLYSTFIIDEICRIIHVVQHPLAW